MKILSLNYSHDASVSIIENGILSFYRMEERLNHIKHSSFPYYSLLEAKRIYKEFDFFVINGLHLNETYLKVSYWIDFLKKLDCGLNENNYIVEHEHHHLNHARTSFYHSGFDEALCIVLDGAGNIFQSTVYEGIQCRELESVFYIKKPNNFQLIFKRFFTGTGMRDSNHYRHCNGIENKIKTIEGKIIDVEISSEFSVGWDYEECNRIVGFGDYDSGKSMGLSQCYGHEDCIDSEWHLKAKICNKTQNHTLKKSISIIQRFLKESPTKNLIITGGYGLNCVSNYEYLKELDVNIFIDPLCDDGSISIGAGFFHYFEKTKDYKNLKLNNVYFGHQETHYDLKNLISKNTNSKEVAKFLSEGKIISIFQGKSECGPRALGNRSILFDPRNINGKDILNTLKKRESFRPFGATVLEKFCDEWFDMRGMKSSPFMLYAMKVIPNFESKIPSVLHVDKTSRIQTINEIQNKNFYDLIFNFYELTNVPMILNTSFNIKNKPIVETFNDALNVFFNSNIDALYLPEINKVIFK